MASDSWYEIVPSNTSLTQGDIIFDSPVLRWKESPSLSIDKLASSVECIKADLVVMTQACDLEQNKVDDAILCPHIGIAEYRVAWEAEMKKRDQAKAINEKSWGKHCSSIKDGFIWNLSMIKENNTKIPMSVRIVDFHDVYALPRKFLEEFLIQRGVERIRLLPPYREHLSQAFARYFMRVGLPVDIQKTW